MYSHHVGFVPLPEAELDVEAVDWDLFAAAIAFAHWYLEPFCQ